MADPATFLASKSVLGTLFFSENSLFTQFVCLFSLYVYLINTINIKTELELFYIVPFKAHLKM